MNIFKRLLLTIYRTMDTSLHLMAMKILRIQYYPPNYVYFDNFDRSSVIVDIGCGHEAELSKHLIEKHDLQAFGVDPTIKHAQSLRILEETTKFRFRYLALAVTKTNGVVAFNQSRQNESGSVLSEHTNVKHDDIETYNVESVNLRELVRRIGIVPIDLVKLDLEGAEYELLDEIGDEDLNPFKQIFIEFHHHCTNHTAQETKQMVRTIRKKGFKVFTRDRHNFLFYK